MNCHLFWTMYGERSAIRRKPIEMEGVRNGEEMSKKESDASKEGISRTANGVKVGQRWERLIARPSGWLPRKIKRARGRERQG